MTTAQAEKLRDALGPYLRYLHRVKRRMEARGFPMTDELFEAMNAAYDAAHGLTMRLHYLSCKSGVGRPARFKEGNQDVERRRRTPRQSLSDTDEDKEDNNRPLEAL